MSVKLHLFVLIYLYSSTNCLIRRSSCNQKTSLHHHSRYIYQFSVNLLNEVSQNRSHFVLSPISTWLQLVDLSEGAVGKTREEIQNITNYHKNLCFRSKFRNVLNKMDMELKESYKRKRLILFDEFFNINKRIKRIIETEKAVKVVTLNFNRGATSAEIVNNAVNTIDTNIGHVFHDSNFEYEELLIISVVRSNNLWKVPFNKVYTRPMPFYSDDRKHVGEVNMMIQINKFNYVNIISKNLKILELPCLNDNVSMLIFLPTKGSVGDVFDVMKSIRLMTIYQMFKNQGITTVKVSLPRFKISSLIDDIPKLLHKMGIKKVFNLNEANFRGFSQFKMHASTMLQMVSLEITEKGVNALAEAVYRQKAIDFTANRPFGFMLVDKKRDLMLFNGIYSSPELY